jgi:hypothetical protein
MNPGNNGPQAPSLTIVNDIGPRKVDPACGCSEIPLGLCEKTSQTL